MRIRGAFWGVPNIRPVILANEACQTSAGSVVKLAGWYISLPGQHTLNVVRRLANILLCADRVVFKFEIIFLIFY